MYYLFIDNAFGSYLQYIVLTWNYIRLFVYGVWDMTNMSPLMYIDPNIDIASILRIFIV